MLIASQTILHASAQSLAAALATVPMEHPVVQQAMAQLFLELERPSFDPDCPLRLAATEMRTTARMLSAIAAGQAAGPQGMPLHDERVMVLRRRLNDAGSRLRTIVARLSPVL